MRLIHLFVLFCLFLCTLQYRDVLYDSIVMADALTTEKLLSLDSNQELYTSSQMRINYFDKIYNRTSLMMCGFDPQDEIDSVDKSCVKIAKLLVKRGVNVTHVDTNGWNALSMSVIRGLTSFSDYLISKDNSSNHINHQDNKGKTALMKAAAHAQLSTFNLLINHKADLTIREFEYGMTALHFASRLASSNESYCSFLSNVLNSLSNTTIDLVDINGRTALMYAVINNYENNTRAIEILLDHGADPRLFDYFGVSVISMTKLERNKMILSDAVTNRILQDHSKWMKQTEHEDTCD